MRANRTMTLIPGATNIMSCVDASKIQVYCDLHRESAPSKSGKSILVGTTGASRPLGNSGATLSLNVTRSIAEPLKLNQMSIGPAWNQFEPLSCPGLSFGVFDQRYLGIQLDFTQTVKRPSASGKSTLLASSGGFVRVGQSGARFGLNCGYTTHFDVTRLHEVPSPQGQSVEPSAVELRRDGNHMVAICPMDSTAVGESVTFKSTPLADKATVQLVVTRVANGPSTDSSWAEVGPNCEACIKNNSVQLRWSTTEHLHPSASFRSLLVSSSEGFQAFGPFRINFNVFKALSDEYVRTLIRQVLDTVPDEALLSYPSSKLMKHLMLALNTDRVAPQGFYERVKYFQSEYVHRRQHTDN